MSKGEDEDKFDTVFGGVGGGHSQSQPRLATSFSMNIFSNPGQTVRKSFQKKSWDWSVSSQRGKKMPAVIDYQTIHEMCCHMIPDMELLRFCMVTVDPATVARAFRTVLRNRIFLWFDFVWMGFQAPLCPVKMWKQRKERTASINYSRRT